VSCQSVVPGSRFSFLKLAMGGVGGGNPLPPLGPGTITDSIGRIISITQGTLSYQDASAPNGTATVTWSGSTTPQGQISLVNPPLTANGVAGSPTILTLQNGATFHLDYDNFGMLTKVTYPQGGYTRYEYQTHFFNRPGPPDSYGGGTVVATDARQVSKRHVCRMNSGACTLAQEDTFTYTPAVYTTGYANNPAMDVVDPFGNKTSFTFTTTGGYSGTYPGDLEQHAVRELSRLIYDGSTAVRTVTTDYSDAPPYTWSLPTKKTTTLNSGKVSTVQWTYPTQTFIANQGSEMFLGPSTVSHFIDTPTTMRETDFDGTYRLTGYTWQSGGKYTLGQGHILDRLQQRTVGNLTTTFGYDTVGNLLTKALSGPGAATSTTSYQRNLAGEVTKITDSLLHATLLDYANQNITGCPANPNPIGLPTSMTDPNVHATLNAYFPDTGRLACTADANGNVTRFQYDANGRVIETDYADGSFEKTVFNDTSPAYVQKTSSLNSSGATMVSKNLLDGVGHAIQSQLLSDPVGTVLRDTIYDGLERVSSVSNPYRLKTELTYGVTKTKYDAQSRTVKRIYPDAKSEQWCYDGLATTGQTNCRTNLASNANVTWVDYADEAGTGWQRGYDGLGRLVQVLEPNNSGVPSFETRYNYDVLNDLSGVQQKNGSGVFQTVRSFAYDSLGRLMTATNPETGAINYTYDTNSNVKTKKDARGITTSYTYEFLNRLKRKTYTDGTPEADYNYDETQIIWPSFSVTVSNGIGKLTSESVGGNPGTYAQSHSYDVMGRPTASRLYETSPGTSYGYQVISYNLAGQVTEDDNSALRSFQKSYDVAGHLASLTTKDKTGQAHPLVDAISYSSVGESGATLHDDTTGATRTETRTYDKRLRALSYNVANGANSVYSWQLGYGSNNNVTSQAGPVMGNWTYTYDKLNRVLTGNATSGADSGMTLHWSYDAYGNRLTASATGAGSGQYTPSSFTISLLNGMPSNQLSGFSYDASGNLLVDNVGNVYTYDAENRISSVTTASATTNYNYDAEGRLVLKTTSSQTWSYVWDNNGHIVRRILNGQQFGLPEDVWANGRHIATLTTATDGSQLKSILWTYTDWLGTVRQNDGSDQTAYMSLPFGDTLTPPVSVSAPHFTGKERDAESRLDNFGARYNASGMGRFMTPDWSESPDTIPYGHLKRPQSLNLYAYVENNPLSTVDPDGHEKCKNGTEASACVYATPPDVPLNWRAQAVFENPIFKQASKTVNVLGGTLAVGYRRNCVWCIGWG
jgi:RHS repeat-associated protein